MLRASKHSETISFYSSSVGIAVCWLIVFGVFVFYGAQTRYGSHVANAIVAQDSSSAVDDSHLAQADTAILTESVSGIAPH
jgi:fucose permease